MIFLTLPYPISANAYWGTRIVKPHGKPAMAMVYVTHEARKYKAGVLKAWADSGQGAQLTGRISIAIHLYPQRPQDWQRRMRLDPEGWSDTVRCLDLDNVNKVLLDALKGVAFEDDRWVRQLQSARMEPDDEGARVEIWIRRMGAGAPRQKSLPLTNTLETA